MIESPSERERLAEVVKLGFQSMTQLTTLNAGSIVVIGTFLKDIFHTSNGTLDVSPTIKLLIAAAFVCFGASLIFAAMALFGYTWTMQDILLVGDRADRGLLGALEAAARSRIRQLPLPFFTAGLLCFGLSVILNLDR